MEKLNLGADQLAELSRRIDAAVEAKQWEPAIDAAREHGRVDLALKLATATDEQIKRAMRIVWPSIRYNTGYRYGYRYFVRELCAIVSEEKL